MRTITPGIHLNLAALAWLTVAGCGSDDLSAPNPRVGSLAVTITAPFALGRELGIVVTGPTGVREVVGFGDTRMLHGLEPGTYTVSATPLTRLHPVFGTARYDPVISDATVLITAGATASVSVSYIRQRGATGALWVANAGRSSVVSFSVDGLLASTADPPNTVTSTDDGQQGAAFDAHGSLWLSQTASDRLVKYTASQLAAGGSPTPAVVLSASTGSIGSTSLAGPAGLMFDPTGKLWVANSGNNTLVAFTPSQLESNGSPTPGIVLSSIAGSLDHPTGLAFTGHLWVANRHGNTVVAFSTAQQAASGAPEPAITLRSAAFVAPFALAFSVGDDDYSDEDDYLWVSNIGSHSVVRFSWNQLLRGGTIAPRGALSAVGGSLAGPAGLVFDQSGALWVANQSGNTVVRFTRSQLFPGGAQTPEVIVSGDALAGPTALAPDPQAFSDCAAGC